MKTFIRIGSVILVTLLSTTTIPSRAVAENGADGCHVRPHAKSYAPPWKRTCRDVAARKSPAELAQAGSRGKTAATPGDPR